jgi:glycosyltransferase involved in cell wall biosynthesis
MSDEKQIWMSWHLSRRSKTLSERLNIPLVAVQYEKGVLLRQLLSSAWSVAVLLRLRPRVICLQYSFLLLVILALYKKINSGPVTLICDCHTKALRRRLKGPGAKTFNRLKKWSMASVHSLIISNQEQVGDAGKFNDSYLVVPDFIPDMGRPCYHINGPSYCVFPMSFDRDEPVEAIVKAIELLAAKYDVYVTGRGPASCVARLEGKPKVHLTGFVSDGVYRDLVRNAGCLVSLTCEEGCLQCSGYEALALEVPFVTSPTRALHEYFGESAVYVRHTPELITAGVREAVTNRQAYRKRMASLKEARVRDDRNNLLLLSRLLQ